MDKTIFDMCNVPDKILQQLQTDIAEIKVALLGNEYNPTAGLLYRTSELEKEYICLKNQLELQQSKFNRIVWTGIGVGTGVGFLWMIITQVLDKLIIFAQ
jgi:hypothetical protein